MLKPEKNKLVKVGIVGSNRCYVNVSEEEALRRYLESEPSMESVKNELCISTIEFDDEFCAYDVWST